MSPTVPMYVAAYHWLPNNASPISRTAAKSFVIHGIALSMAMPWMTNDFAAVLLMGLALFGNQWYAATYIGTVGDIVPQHLVGRVNGIAGFGDNGAVTFAILYT